MWKDAAVYLKDNEGSGMGKGGARFLQAHYKHLKEIGRIDKNDKYLPLHKSSSSAAEPEGQYNAETKAEAEAQHGVEVEVGEDD